MEPTVQRLAAAEAAPTNDAANATFADCPPGSLQPCPVKTPLIDPNKVWDEAERNAAAIAAKVGAIWKGEVNAAYSRYAYEALTQKYCRRIMMTVFFLMALTPVRNATLIGSFPVPFLAVGVILITIIVIGGVILVMHEARLRTEFDNAVQDVLRHEIILYRGHQVAAGLQRLEHGQRGSGQRAEECLETIFAMWRGSQLWLYFVEKEWNPFRGRRVNRHDELGIGPWFWCGVVLVFVGMLWSIVSAVSQIERITVTAAGAAYEWTYSLPVGWLGEDLTAMLWKGAGLLAWLILVRLYFRKRAFALRKAIDNGIKEHSITATVSNPWKREIAEFDPLPHIARRHHELLDQLYEYKTKIAVV